MLEHEIFMNLCADYAFKRVFGTELNKKALMRFLNVLFKKDGIIVNDVVYHSKEVLPDEKSDSDPTKRGKQIVYDVYCSAKGVNHHFILEMQQKNIPFFDDRAFYYAVKALASQGKVGWNYELFPVFSIFILGFNLSNHTEKLIHDFRMSEVETHEQYTDKLRMIFISLPQVKRKWNDCTTEEDRLLFIIKNMHKMTKESEPYKSGEYRDLFDASEINSLAAEDMVLYSQSYAKMRDDKLAMEYATEEAKAAGLAEGRAEGRVEGRAEGIEKMMANLIEMGFDPEILKRAADKIK